ncbi:MAG TPA: hypothetical protein VE135_17395 [Pyrinomonadaceae bacterium]|nr:hypothetical protein [Pyrinomonadaceae bacterium]
MSRFKTNLFVCAGGIILSFVIFLCGAWVTLQIISRNPYFGTNNKDQLISFLLIRAFILLPGVAVVVGMFVGYFIQKGAWCWVVISLLPLLIYDLEKGQLSGMEIVLRIIYLTLGLISAVGISKLRRRVFNRKTHA